MGGGRKRDEGYQWARGNLGWKKPLKCFQQCKQRSLQGVGSSARHRGKGDACRVELKKVAPHPKMGGQGGLVLSGHRGAGGGETGPSSSSSSSPPRRLPPPPRPQPRPPTAGVTTWTGSCSTVILPRLPLRGRTRMRELGGGGRPPPPDRLRLRLRG